MSVARKFRMLSGAARVGLGQQSVPMHISWIVTNRCNLRCSYCNRPDDPTPELTLDKALQLVDMLAAEGCVQLSITGGDPLVRQDLPMIMARARRHGIKINLNTNGILVPKREDVVRMADGVTVSLDGPPEVHDKIRGNTSFGKAVEGAKHARKMGIPTRYYTVIGKSNIPELDYLVGMAEDLPGEVFFQPGATYILGSGDGVNPDAAPEEHYKRGVDQLIAWKKQGRPIGNSVAGLEYIRNWPHPAPINCMGGRLFARIDVDGQLRPCGRVPRGPENSVFGEGGIRGAMARVKGPDCSACYSAARTEVNLMCQGSPDALKNFFMR
ncbi:MAG: radical SAM protein [Deltaproteobacteria bacterium]|nr:radical SAM protein [Deltaproteobacteria bacterium]